jgi:hypothetical protein
MGDALKANFEAFVAKQQDENVDEESKEETKEDDFDIFQDLKTKNGRNGDAIFSMLLTRVFDEDTSKVEAHLINYLMGVLDKQFMTQGDIVGGLNMFGACLADLALDVPMIHQYLAHLVIRPLVEKEKLDVTKVSWVAPVKPKTEEDDEEEYLFGNDPFFKMLALVLADLTKEGYSAD